MVTEVPSAAIGSDDAEVRNFPHPSLPTIFADSARNIMPSNGMARFYLARWDPTLTGSTGVTDQTIAQVVMPIESFVQMVAFFNEAISAFASEGRISKEMVERIRAAQNVKHER